MKGSNSRGRLIKSRNLKGRKKAWNASYKNVRRKKLKKIGLLSLAKFKAEKIKVEAETKRSKVEENKEIELALLMTRHAGSSN